MVESIAMRAALFLFLIASTFPSLARAADNKQVARECYIEGKKQYDVGEFDKALALFKKAYLNYPEPTFLFNMAQCQRQLGDKVAAVRSFKTYLREYPDAPNRATVERIIGELEAPPATTPPPPANAATTTTPARPTTPPPTTATPPSPVENKPVASAKQPTTPPPPVENKPVETKPAPHRPARWEVTEMEEVTPNFDRPLAHPPGPSVAKKWWFWTIVVGVVAGAVAAAVAIPLTQSASTNSFTTTLPGWTASTGRAATPGVGTFAVGVRW